MLRAALAASILVVPALVAAADPPVGVLLPGEKVRDTLSSDGETRTAGFAGVAKAKCTIKAKALPKSRVQPTLALTSPSGAPADLGKSLRAKGATAQIAGFAFDATGVWRVSLTTPADHGGAFELSTAMKVPTKASLRGATAGEPAVGEATFDALPGTTLKSLTVKVTAKPAWTPEVELFGPDGASLGNVPGTRSSASLRGIVLPDLGTYRVVVRGGAGAFKASAVLQPPRKSARTWPDVEARPDIASFTPTTVDNDSHVDFTLTGIGFSTQQTFRIQQGGATRFAKAVTTTTQTGATVSADLPALPAGEYDVEIGTPAANRVVAATKLTVRNRVPGVVTVQPTVLPTGDDWPVLLKGAGFDAGVAVTLRRTSDGTQVPVEIQSRPDHQTLNLLVSPPPYVVGPCDLEVRDPDGLGNVLSAAVDVLGWRAAPASVRTYSGGDQTTGFYPRDAAFDPVSGRACIAVQESTDAVWVLVDTTTWTVLDSLKITRPSSPWRIVNPRVAWSAVDGTWALCWVQEHPNSTDQAHVRIVDGADLDATVRQQQVGQAALIEQVHAASDPVLGGWVVVHDRYAGSGAGDIWALALAADGSGDTANQTLAASDPNGWAYYATILAQRSGQFVMAYAGADNGDTRWAVRRVVLDEQAKIVYGSAICASVGTWQNIYQPELGVNAEDGSMVLAFTYLEDFTFRPACLTLSKASASPGDVVSLDDQGLRPQGFIDSLVWNPTRKEFVIALSTYSEETGYDVTLRRIGGDGKIRPSQYLQSVEGVWGILWSGPSPDSLFMVRAFDGTDDGYVGGTGAMMVHGGPVR